MAEKVIENEKAEARVRGGQDLERLGRQPLCCPEVQNLVNASKAARLSAVCLLQAVRSQSQELAPTSSGAEDLVETMPKVFVGDNPYLSKETIAAWEAEHGVANASGAERLVSQSTDEWVASVV